MAVLYISVFLMLIFIFTLIAGSYENKKQWTNLNLNGVTKDDLIHVGAYLGGHPGLNSSNINSVIYKLEKDLIIAEQPVQSAAQKKKSFILISSIKIVQVEDSNSIEKRVTLNRALLVGLFDLILHKKNTNEIAFLVIDWIDNRSEHSTIFLLEGKNAMHKAINAQEKIVKLLN